MCLINYNNSIVKRVNRSILAHFIQMSGAHTVVVDKLVFIANHFIQLLIEIVFFFSRQTFVVGFLLNIHHPCPIVCSDKIFGERKGVGELIKQMFITLERDKLPELIFHIEWITTFFELLNIIASE